MLERRGPLVGLAMVAIGIFGCGSTTIGPQKGTGGRPGTTGAGGAPGSGGTSGTGGVRGSGGVAGAGGLFGTGGVSGTGGVGTGGTGGGLVCTPPALGEVPSEHRPSAVVCSPNTAPAPAGGFPSCATNADCTVLGYGSCMNGRCSNDACLSDGDCGPNALCVCNGAEIVRLPPSGADGGTASVAYPAGGAAGAPGNGSGNVYFVGWCLPASCRVDSDCGAGGYCSPSFSPCGSLQGYHCHGASDSCLDATKDCASCGRSSCTYSTTAGAFTCNPAACIGGG